jgi:hypothetical protein
LGGACVVSGGIASSAGWLDRHGSPCAVPQCVQEARADGAPLAAGILLDQRGKLILAKHLKANIARVTSMYHSSQQTTGDGNSY